MAHVGREDGSICGVVGAITVEVTERIIRRSSRKDLLIGARHDPIAILINVDQRRHRVDRTSQDDSARNDANATDARTPHLQREDRTSITPARH
jgi:hypothetical protein